MSKLKSTRMIMASLPVTPPTPGTLQTPATPLTLAALPTPATHVDRTPR